MVGNYFREIYFCEMVIGEPCIGEKFWALKISRNTTYVNWGGRDLSLLGWGGGGGGLKFVLRLGGEET